MADPFTAIAGIGTLLGGAGALTSAVRGGGGGGASAPMYDYATLYQSQLLPGNTLLTTAATELAQLMAPYVGTEAAQTRVLGQAAYDQFDVAKQKEQTLSGLQAALPQMYASSAISLGDLNKKAQIATEMLGPETASALTRQYAQGVQELATEGLKGQTTLLTPAATALATIATEAQRASNKLAGDIASTNLDIRRQQEQTRNQLALQRATVEGKMAIKRQETGLTLAGQHLFA